MIRALSILTLFSVLLAGCITGQPAASGTLQLTSSPSGAGIYLDDQFRGSTPFTLTGVVPGNHTLEFRSNGYTSWKNIIAVPQGTSNYFASLTAQQGQDLAEEGNETGTGTPSSITIAVSKDPMIVKE